MNNSTPPSLPPGWIALWDEASQRYYYVEQATGTTQWEIPTGASKAFEAGVGSSGDASSYNDNSGYPQQYPPTTYPQQNQGESSSYMNSPATSVNTSYPTQSTPGTEMTGEEGGDRGLGKVFSGFSGGAITGSLLGYAAGKYFTNKHNQHQGYNQYPPPPPQFGGYQQGHHHHQHHHQQSPGGPGAPGFPGYNPPPPSNYGGGFGAIPPKKHSFW
ncbi:MAG: hypothetical protein EXX96DRAFT_620324 [Benjaminiella poitrasii]|nr:MAG: hypothetical protein EXX96DRAFT_620324 [Benjaminiella poitrasii]